MGGKTHRAFFALANEVSAVLNYSIFSSINMALQVKPNYDQPLQNQAGQYAVSNHSQFRKCKSELNIVPQTY